MALASADTMRLMSAQPVVRFGGKAVVVLSTRAAEYPTAETQNTSPLSNQVHRPSPLCRKRASVPGTRHEWRR